MPAQQHKPTELSSPEATLLPEKEPTSQTAGSNQAMAEKVEPESSGIGGYLSGLIEDKLTAGKVDDAAGSAIDSGGDWLKDALKDAATEEEYAKAGKAGAAGIDQLASGFGDQFKDSKIGENVAGWASDHPFLTTGLAAAGVAGYILSDQDLEFGKGFDIGDHHSLDFEGEFGSTLHPGVDALRGGYTFDDGTHKAHIEGGSRFDRDEWDVKGSYKQKFDDGTSFSLNGSHTDKAGDTFSTLGASYDGKELDAYMKGSYDSAEDLGRFQAGFTKTGDGPDWKGSFDANTRGDWDAMLGVTDSSKDGNFSWFAGLGAGSNSGNTEMQAKAGFSYKF